jgi:hypothetical protein
MVVVLGERFGELEPSESVRSGNATNDARTFEHQEMPVGRALRDAGKAFHHLGEAHRVLTACQKVDDSPATLRVAKVGAS